MKHKYIFQIQKLVRRLAPFYIFTNLLLSSLIRDGWLRIAASVFNRLGYMAWVEGQEDNPADEDL